MSGTFTKLFGSITESTVWCEPSDIRIVWITLLAMADRHGRVWGTIPGLANRARVSVSVTREAIKLFQEPDEDSRTKDFEGRRIKEIDGGWALLNHGKYRSIRDEDQRRANKAESERKRRARIKDERGQESGQKNPRKSPQKAPDSRGQTRGQNGQTWTGVDACGHNADADTEAKNLNPPPSGSPPTPPPATQPASCEPPDAPRDKPDTPLGPALVVSPDPEKNPTIRDLATLAVLASPYYRAKPDVAAATITAAQRSIVFAAARWEIENYLSNPVTQLPSLGDALEALRRCIVQHEKNSPKEFNSYRSKKLAFYFADKPYHNEPEKRQGAAWSKTGRLVQEMQERHADPDYYRKTYGISE